MPVDFSSELSLGIVTLLSIAIERTSRIWLSSLGNARTEAVVASIAKWFPPILTFAFLTSFMSSAFAIDAVPWLLIVPLAAALVLIYVETRSDGRPAPASRNFNAPEGVVNDHGKPDPGRNDSEPVNTLDGRAQTPRGELSTSAQPVKDMATGTSKSADAHPQQAADFTPRTAKPDPSHGARDQLVNSATHEQSATSPSPGQADAPSRDVVYGLTENAKRLLEFKPPSGRRGGGPLHVKMMKVMYYFYLEKGWYVNVDEGDEKEQRPDFEVWEPLVHLKRLEDGTVREEWDTKEWDPKPFHVEFETTPRKSKSSVIENYEKAWRLQRYVVFVVPSKQDANDLRKILEEIGASKDTYEVDDISDLLSEYSEQRAGVIGYNQLG
ncbi:MAG: hypothetical protein LYZ69_03910 [Nitrososphaerales archaeon]|nr:hypothetical protein [Nitrososphaerales archaeon]